MTTPAPNSPAATYARFGHVPVTVPMLTASSQQLVTGIGLVTSITGYNLGATAPAQYALHDGTGTTGPVLAYLAMPAGAGFEHSAALPGIYFGTGLYVGELSGAGLFAVTYVPLTEPWR